MIDPGDSPEVVSADTSTTKRSVIHRIVATALAQPILVLVASVALGAVGVWSFSRLPIDAYPDLSPPRVGISTQWPGQAAEEVERLITVPIETEMNGTPGLHVMRSISFFGLSSVAVTFEDGTDPYFARQQVFERLANVTLPTGVSASVQPLFSPSGLVYRYVLQSTDRTPMELKTLNDWVLAKAYKSVKGVADMSGFGGPTMEYHVDVDATRLAGAGLGVSDVVTALGNSNGNAGGGFYSEGGQFYYVRGLGRLQTPEDIGNVVLAVRNSTPILSETLLAWRSVTHRALECSGSTRTATRSKVSSSCSPVSRRRRYSRGSRRRPRNSTHRCCQRTSRSSHSTTAAT